MNGCLSGSSLCHPVNFGALPPLPEGWSVWWHDCMEMYQAEGPNDRASAVTWNRFWARRWVFDLAVESKTESKQENER